MAAGSKFAGGTAPAHPARDTASKDAPVTPLIAKVNENVSLPTKGYLLFFLFFQVSYFYVVFVYLKCCTFCDNIFFLLFLLFDIF